MSHTLCVARGSIPLIVLAHSGLHFGSCTHVTIPLYSLQLSGKDTGKACSYNFIVHRWIA